MKLADQTADAKKRMKAISFPEMDSDGLPSSYVLRVNVCIGKWTTKLLALDKELEKFDQTEKVKKLPGFFHESCLLG